MPVAEKIKAAAVFMFSRIFPLESVYCMNEDTGRMTGNPARSPKVARYLHNLAVRKIRAGEVQHSVRSISTVSMYRESQRNTSYTSLSMSLSVYIRLTERTTESLLMARILDTKKRARTHTAEEDLVVLWFLFMPLHFSACFVRTKFSISEQSILNSIRTPRRERMP